MPTKDKDGVEIMFLETVEQGDSGFYMDGTAGTPYAQQLRTPTISWIPTEGIEVYLDEKGIKRQRPIRHIKGCENIYPKEQELMGFKPNRQADKIPMDNGFINIKREQSNVGTFDYLLKATYFADNPLRPATATKIYREIKINERAVDLLDQDELSTAAKAKVFALRLSTGDKGNYRYSVDKINIYCSLLQIVEPTPEQQLVALLNKATQNPKLFLEIIVKAEQTVVTEVTHALQLGVIMFDGNNVQYAKENKMITSLGTVKLSKNKQIEAFADYLQTPEGNNDLTELRTMVEVEKEKQYSK